MPGECSSPPSPDDARAPSRPPARHKLSCWQSGLPAPRAFLPSADQVVGCLFLAQKPRKRGDAKASVLAQRRDAVLGSWALQLRAPRPLGFICPPGGCIPRRAKGPHAREGCSSALRKDSGQDVGTATPSSRPFRAGRDPVRREKGKAPGAAPATQLPPPRKCCRTAPRSLRAEGPERPAQAPGNGSETQRDGIEILSTE